MEPHNEALTRQLKRVRDQIDVAIEDAAEDFRGGLAHAEIGLTLLDGVVKAGRATNAQKAEG